MYGHSLITNPSLGMYQEIHPHRAISIDSVKIIDPHNHEYSRVRDLSNWLIGNNNSKYNIFWKAYILKADVLDVRTPQKIQIFRRKIF